MNRHKLIDICFFGCMLFLFLSLPGAVLGVVIFHTWLLGLALGFVAISLGIVMMLTILSEVIRH